MFDRTCSMAALCLLANAAYSQPTVTHVNLYAQALSADGRVVAGMSLSGTGDPAYWSHAGGLVHLGLLAGNSNLRVTGISGDGSVITGSAYNGSHGTSWLWTQATGYVPITVPGATTVTASCISRDGSTVGGAAVGAPGCYSAFVWTLAEGGRWVPQGGNYASWITGLSPNGLRATGSGSSGRGTWPMFWGSTYVWPDPLEPVTGWLGGTGAAMTPDTSAIVGYAYGNPAEALAWDPNGGITFIGPPGGFEQVRLEAVSDDGLVAAGYVYSQSSGYTATIWRRGAGLSDARSYFAVRGLTTAGLTEIMGVSANGRVFADRGYLIELGACGAADFDHDGDTGTDADIAAFFACLAGNCCPICDSADFNGDGDTGTDADIEAFFRVLAGGSC